MSLTLSLDFQFASSIEKVWSALTDSGKLAKWIMANDFKAEVGHRFQFKTQATEYWNGIVEGEVLIVDAPTLLSYTFVGGEAHTVTWTLKELEDGQVNLHLEQTGISNPQALGGAKYGWTNWIGELEKLLAQ